MNRRDKFQPSWDRIGDYELGYAGVVLQPELLAYTTQQLLSEADEYEIPLSGARAIARHLANLQGRNVPTALHHFAIIGTLRVGAVMEELSELVIAHDGDDLVRQCAIALTRFIDQEDRYQQRGPDAGATP